MNVRKLAVLTLCSMFVLASCGTNDGRNNNNPVRQQSSSEQRTPISETARTPVTPGEQAGGQFHSASVGQSTPGLPGVSMLTASGGDRIKVTPLMRDGEVWVPLKVVSDFYEYHYEWDAKDKEVKIGKSDVLFEVEADSTKAKIGDHKVTLHKPPFFQNNQVYIEVSSLGQLMQTNASWDEGSQSVVLTTRIDTPAPNSNPIAQNNITTQEAGTGAGTAGDANGDGTDLSDADSDVGVPDGNTGTDTGTAEPGTGAGNGTGGTGGGAAADKATEAISFAKDFLGTPYLWAAGPYEKTKRFDCSSYMQYIFKHIGITLPRTSRSQSTVGKLVSRDELQPGDLLFFYVPGRYSSNKIVGHVGMYIGNNQMIHTTNKPGVTIVPLTGSISARYLWARRVL